MISETRCPICNESLEFQRTGEGWMYNCNKDVEMWWELNNKAAYKEMIEIALRGEKVPIHAKIYTMKKILKDLKNNRRR